MQVERRKVHQNILYLILLQNLFCINRTHCFEKRLYKILGQIICFISLLTVIGFNIFEIVTYISYTKKNIFQTINIFSYAFQSILGAELLALAILAKQSDNIYKKLKLLEEKCETKQIIIKNKQTTEDFTNDNSKKIITLSLISAIVDIIGLNFLDYSTSVIITLTVAFAAHDTELLFYSVIINEFNVKLIAVMDVSAELGVRMYRHILIAASHFTEDYKFTICLTVIMTLTTTVIYIGAAIAMEGPQVSLTTQRVLSYFIWREIRSLFSLWLLCSASYQTRILGDGLVKRLSERLVFELDSKDKSSRKLTKRWLKCVKLTPVRYLDGSCYTLSPALPLSVLDYSTNYLLIIVQMYPLVMKKVGKAKLLKTSERSS